MSLYIYRKDVQTLALDHLTAEDIKEMSLIEIATGIFAEKKQSVTFSELLTEIKELTGFTDENLKGKISQFYTDLNIDGRFICIGENQWGLRAWYPYDQIEEETTPQVKTKKKKVKKAVDEELESDEFEDLDEEELEFDDLEDYEEDDDAEEEEDFDADDDSDDDDEEFEEDIIEEDDEYEELDEEDELEEDEEEDL
ncbi:DNA-directed RNA polymerase subunit delta [Sutcliffiella rhizosphaerae]|uniref:Probable DNA-directed RNA polymerase subunit delta n=1 Tax=Sutcliffiella rhizosphaerae TaxID=2880967 RepID=A0ABM8YJN2_9BACI|nr:DNA-directed RNA polymerase subunit delta [Sutcliffiella rhizosphaerae]CAG9620103.1 DNA-directed RNA polymerase subunit delta [Sutcliffiella rhizosphaerae]